jgi:3-keto-5-aminohexanoate cleavage enzyme
MTTRDDMTAPENTVHWDRVAKGLERDRHRMIWRPYGYPEIVDPENSYFHDGGVQPKWDMPPQMIVQSAITGAFFTDRANPAQPITPAAILQSARECALAGASAVHIHVRDDRGYNTLSYDRFAQVIEPLREEFPGLSIDGCLVCALDGEWDEMKRVLEAGLFDAVPVNSAAVYNGDALFAKPAPMLLEKTRLILESGTKPIIAVYADADVDNADRFLFRSGLLEQGQLWCVLPGLPGCSPMNNPLQMVNGLLRFVALIRDVDPDATILVCAAGRASSYLATVAAALGLHIRVGMEDTVWRWPHRGERLESNVAALRSGIATAAVLGRSVASPEEYRRLVGLPIPARSVT